MSGDSGRWRVEPDQPRDTRPPDTYDVIDDDGREVAWPLANLTFDAATAVADAHNAALTPRRTDEPDG